MELWHLAINTKCHNTTQQSLIVQKYDQWNCLLTRQNHYKACVQPKCSNMSACRITNEPLLMTKFDCTPENKQKVVWRCSSGYEALRRFSDLQVRHKIEQKAVL